MWRLVALLISTLTWVRQPFCAEQLELTHASTLVRVDSDDDCVRADVLEQRVLEILSGVDIPEDLSVGVSVSEKIGFVLRRSDQEIAARDFDELPTSCEARLDALAVVVALSIEHAISTEQVSERTEKTREEPEAQPALTPSATLSESGAHDDGESTDPTTFAPEARLSFRFSGGVSYLLGVMAVSAPATRLSLDVLPKGNWAFGLGFLSSERMRIEFETPRGSTDEAFSRADSQLIAGGLHACFEQPFLREAAFNVCAGGWVGLVHSRGVGGFGARAGVTPWLSGAVSGGARVPARGPFGLHFGADLFANVLRPGVQLAGAGSVTQAQDGAPIGGALNLSAFFVAP